MDVVPGNLFDNGAEHIAGARIIEESAAGFGYDGECQEGLFPGRSFGGMFEGLNGIFLLADGHAQQVPDLQRGEVRADRGRLIFREKRDDRVVEFQQLLVDRHSDGRSGKAFTKRVELLVVFRGKSIPPAFGDDVTVADDHDAMKFLAACVNGG